MWRERCIDDDDAADECCEVMDVSQSEILQIRFCREIPHFVDD